MSMIDRFVTRRDLLYRGGMGIGALALRGVMGDAFGNEVPSAVNIDSLLAPRQPHFAAKAKRVIHLFLSGGPSHVDTFDPKPGLDKYHGQPLPESMHLVTESLCVGPCGPMDVITVKMSHRFELSTWRNRRQDCGAADERPLAACSLPP